MLRQIWESWKSFAKAMGNFQSRILLGLFYFLVVTPFGVGVRFLSDPLHLRRPTNSSNWIPKVDAPPTFDEARKHF